MPKITEKQLKKKLNLSDFKEIPLSLIPYQIMINKENLINLKYGNKDNFNYLARMSHKNKWN